MSTKKRKKKKPVPVWRVVLTDVLIFGVCLVVFALFHHVLFFGDNEGVVLSARPTVAAAPAATPAPSPESEEDAAATESDFIEPDDTETSPVEPDEPASEEESEITEEPVIEEEPAVEEDTPVETEAEPVETPAPAPQETQAAVVGCFGDKFVDKFTDGEVIANAEGYRSANLNITFNTYEKSGVRFHVMDFYIKDITCFRTGFAYDRYGKAAAQWPKDIAKRMNAVAAISGDYYGLRTSGTIIRNGVLYRSNYDLRDTCVLYWDGTVETFKKGTFDTDAECQKGVYQTWTFGPALLGSDGKACAKFDEDKDIQKANPRSLFGYYEPGHYCFVNVEGRVKGSSGLSLTGAAKLMESLGCVRAYNLDGGATAQMVYGGKVVNSKPLGARPCTDVLALVDEIQQ